MNKILFIISVLIITVNGLTFVNQTYSGLNYFGRFKSGQYNLQIQLTSSKPISIAFFPSSKLNEFKKISIINPASSIVKLTLDVKTIMWTSTNISYKPKQYYGNINWFIGIIPSDNTEYTLNGKIILITSESFYKNSIFFTIIYIMMVLLTLINVIPRIYIMYKVLDGRKRYDLNWC